MNVLYIGNEIDVIEPISAINEIDVVACIFQKSKLQISDSDLSFRSFVPVESKADFIEAISRFYDSVDFAIMYSFGIIIPKDVIEHIKIYNFHPGDLRTNRGSSPINWSILLNEKCTMMTLHCVDSGIDSGNIITEHECLIYENDVPYTLKKRMEGEIPSMIIELLHLQKKNFGGYRVHNGIYRNRITEKSYTICPGDSREIISAKIRSQYNYKGAIFFQNGKKIYIKSMEEYDFIREQKNEIFK